LISIHGLPALLGPQYECSYVVDESTDLGIQIVVSNRECRPIAANDFASQLERTDGLNKNVQTHFRPQLGKMAGRIQPSTGFRNIDERPGAFAFTGRTQNVELCLETRVGSAIHDDSEIEENDVGGSFVF
jgi:hypothetical protein